MKALISLCFLLLVTLSSSQYLVGPWRLCPGGPLNWVPLFVQLRQDPNLQQVLTFSPHGYGETMDFQTLLVSGSIGANYTWNSSSPYAHHCAASTYFALNYTTYLPSLNETYVNLTIRGIDVRGREVACVEMVAQNITPISFEKKTNHRFDLY